MTEPISLGLIGCDPHALLHAQIGRANGFEVTGVYDRNETLAYRAAGSTASVFPSDQALLDSGEVDAVVLFGLRVEELRWAVRHGKHVLTHLPLSTTTTQLKEAERALREATQHGLVVRVCLPHRYDPFLIRLRDQIPEFVEQHGRLYEIGLYRYLNQGEISRGMLERQLAEGMDLVSFLSGQSLTSHGPADFRKSGSITDGSSGTGFYFRLTCEGRPDPEIKLWLGFTGGHENPRTAPDDRESLTGVMTDFATAIRTGQTRVPQEPDVLALNRAALTVK